MQEAFILNKCYNWLIVFFINTLITDANILQEDCVKIEYISWNLYTILFSNKII